MEAFMDTKDMTGTFPTEVEFDATQDKTAQLEEFKKAASVDYRLPSSVNYIALRESLLSEAPFVTKTNKLFWRKMVDDSHYQNVLAASYRHVLGCISDIGNVNVDRLLDMDLSHYTEVMSTNIAEMIFTVKMHDRDLFFAKLPEITSFMIIEALHTSTPKHYRVYNSVRFREILLDWTSELLMGIRLSNCKANREWLFSNAQESNIMTSSTSTVKFPPLQTSQTAATSLFSMEHSPLVRMYMGRDPHKQPTSGGLGYKVALSHSRDRPLTVMNDYALLRLGKTYNRKCDMRQVHKTLKETISKKKNIMKEYTANKDNLNADLRKLKESYHTHIDHLSNKKVTKAKLLQAIQANNSTATA